MVDVRRNFFCIVLADSQPLSQRLHKLVRLGEAEDEIAGFFCHMPHMLYGEIVFSSEQKKFLSNIRTKKRVFENGG